ncbi:major facilitator superfamily transporter [Klebsiella grimontii]|uniref:Major facilitator superfamily transporter n=1 Tax=Klebsiella grimontii TaxID=2058152 RepID=A0A7H4NZ09_9ENTR|nr:major facilitator superfamily transporter [Klebsiella grimontii]
MDWRHALLIYTLFGLLSAMLLWKMPNHKLPYPRRTIKRQRLSGRDKRSALLYASLIALMTFVSNGTSTHLPEFIASVGLPVAVGMLWGIGQTGARFLEVASGSALTPLRLTLLTTLVMPLCFALGLSGSYLSWAAGGFVLGYGAINGLTTVFKATLPLQLFRRGGLCPANRHSVDSRAAAGRRLAVCLRVAESSSWDEGQFSGFRRAGAGGFRPGDVNCMGSP